MSGTRSNYVRLSMTEQEFVELIELLRDSDEPVAHKLRTKYARHRRNTAAQEPEKTKTPKRVRKEDR